MNFVDLLREHSIPAKTEGHEHCRPGWVQIDCPFCSPNSAHYRLGWNLAYNYGNCWACGPHGLVEIMTTLTGEPARNFVRFVTDLEREHVRTAPRRMGNLELPKGIGKLQYAHREFLVKRHFGNRIAELENLWRIAGIGIAASHSWTIFIPIQLHGETVSWTTRSINNDAQVPYLSARPHQESMFHKHLLYGEDYVRHTAIWVEGPLDVWMVGPGAVCSFGLTYTPQQVTRFRQFARRVICFDNEPVAQRRACKLCDLLQTFPGETINVVMETGKDTSRASRLEVQQLRQRFLED